MGINISNASPVINIREFDLSTSNPDVTPYNSAMVGEFTWGPCFLRKQVTSEAELLKYFDRPNSTNYNNWYNAREYLSYANNLWIVRVVDPDTAKNSGLVVTDDAYGTSTLEPSSLPYIPNKYTTPTITFSAHEKLKIFAKYPGTYGNTNIKVALATAADFSTASINSDKMFKEIFEYIPQTGEFAYYDQVAIVVQTKNIEDNNWNIVEKYIVDLDPDAKNYDKKSNYIENVINTKSEYIYVYDNTSIQEMPNSFEESYLYDGVDSTASTGDYETGYDLYSNSEEFPLWFLFDGGNTGSVLQKYLVSICDTRTDIFGILSIPKDEILDVDLSTAVTNCTVYYNTTLNENTSYAGLYGNSKYIYDRYNDVYRWISISGDVAGIFVDTIKKTNKIWQSPAGDISQMKNALKLAIEPNLAYRDTLYTNNVNPVISLSGQGVQIFGQRTMQSEPSAFRNVNVRLLFLYIESIIKNSARSTLFKINDVYQRNLFIMQTDPFLKNIQAAGGIQEYKIVCDETNNTAQIIDTNNFVVDIYIKPAMTIEIININFTSVGSGLSINEIIRS